MAALLGIGLFALFVVVSLVLACLILYALARSGKIGQPE